MGGERPGDTSSPGRSAEPARDVARGNLSTVCHHLAVLAIEGVTEELALTLDPSFSLHLDHVDTDRWGYLALIDAERAISSIRPPLDVRDAITRGEFVTVALEPRCLAHFRVAESVIAELWMTRELEDLGRLAPQPPHAVASRGALPRRPRCAEARPAASPVGR